MGRSAEPTELNYEQVVFDSWAQWIEKELPERRLRADRAHKRALQISDEAAWQHAEIVERSYGQLEDMHARQDPYFARVRGKMKDADGESFEVDLRVHRYHRSEVFPLSPGGEMLDISHLAPLADLVRNPSQKALHLTRQDREFLDWVDRDGANPHIKVLDCSVEDIELEGGRVVRVAPRYGAIFEDRVRRRLGQSATPALDVLADVLDPEQNAIIANRNPHLRLVILDGPAGTGKTVVAAHRIAVTTAPDSPGLYLTPTPTLRDYVRPVLPRLGLERMRANAWSLVDLAAIMWPDFPWDDNLLGIVPESSATRAIWTRAFEFVRKNAPAATPERIYREAALQIGQPAGRTFGLNDLAALLWLGAWFRRPLPKPSPQWVIIDEAQAIPILAYEAIREWLGPRISWIVAGDLMQQGSHHDGNGWSSIQEALGFSAKRSAHLWLARSYRVPPKIHAAAERLRLALNPEAQPTESVPWHMHTGRITVTRAKTPESLALALRDRVEACLGAGIVSIALLAPNLECITRWDQAMSSWGYDVQVLYGNSGYRGGMVLATLDMVRGLEFDGVLILDVNDVHYPNTPSAARALYTSLTRSRRIADLFTLDTPTQRPSHWLRIVEQGP